jgi:D-alanine transaminase
MDVAMIDDRMLPIVELDKAHLDRGLYFGDGVYEVLRSYDGRLFALDEHLARFERSLKEIMIFDIDIADVRCKVEACFSECGHANAKLYFHITRGSEPRNHLPKIGLKPNFFLTAEALVEDTKAKTQGVSVWTHPDWRWKRCDIKSLNLLPNVMARIAVHPKGASEAILVNDVDEITEGAGSAFFAIDGKEKALITRPLGPEILPSITRAMVAKVAHNAGLTMTERTLSPTQAAGCDELFLAVTTKDIVPITLFDGKPVGDGKVGPLCRKLIAEFAAFARR